MLATLRAQAETLAALEPAVRADEDDAVHQMRVTARTLRANLRTFASVLPDIGDLPEELQWLGDALGPAREAEVLAAHVTGLLERTPPDLVLGPVRARIEQAFGMEREAALEVAIEALDSERYRKLLAALAALEGGAADQDLKPIMRRLYRRVRKRMRAALAMRPGEERDVAMHLARKATRRLRYAAEAIGAPSKRVKKLADVLGAEHDRVVTAAAIKDLAASAQLEGENAFTYGVLLGLVRCDSRDFDKQVQQAWKKVKKVRKEF